ncbi:transcription termination/antitermination protein NusA [Candidatus Dependentiae bacterium Noda2021]|nr:transcription termination/antitermination protein NusA [Candidatus Dependentiae bacterium Noda2021]
MKLAEVIDELVEERGLDKEILSDIVSEGLLAAYQKRYPDLDIRVVYERKTGELLIEIQKEVVATVEDDDTQISLRKVKSLGLPQEIGQRVYVPFDGKIGRIEILRAKQVISSKIRTIESAAVYNEFKDKEGSIVLGTIHKCERDGYVVKVQETLAFLPKSLTIPTDKCVVGYTIRALLKEVLQEPRNDNQLILDRVSDKFLQRLFELEIPEVFEKLVEIKKIVRSPGYKSKVIVMSHDKNIDPVGTCVGVGGARIKPILKELGGEKIDIISASDSIEQLIKDALKPAEINRVQVTDDQNASVWLNDDQRSLAIGKMGQNISLASRLAGINIHLVKNEISQSKSERYDDDIEGFELD